MLSDRTILGMRTHSRIPPGTLCVSKPQTINSANLAYEEGPATEGNNSAKGENMARGLFVCLFVCLSFWGEGVRERERETKDKCFEVEFEGVQRGFVFERKRKATLCRGTEDRKVTGTNSGKSGMRSPKADSTRSREESTVGGHG